MADDVVRVPRTVLAPFLTAAARARYYGSPRARERVVTDTNGHQHQLHAVDHDLSPGKPRDELLTMAHFFALADAIARLKGDSTTAPYAQDLTEALLTEGRAAQLHAFEKAREDQLAIRWDNLRESVKDEFRIRARAEKAEIGRQVADALATHRPERDPARPLPGTLGEPAG